MGLNGWAIPPAQPSEETDEADAGRLYDLLEQQVVPMFYKRDNRGLPVEWLQRMKHAIRTAGERFNARRMVQEYATRFYAPAMRGEAASSVPPL
jgi:starch phosphorylase